MFAEAFTSTTIFAMIIAVSNALVGLFAYLLALHNTKHDKQNKKQEKIDDANKTIDEACDNGSLSDLIDAAKKLGDAKK